MTTLPQHTPMRLPRPNPSHLAIPSANGHAPVSAHQTGSGMTGADIWRVIRANLWLIVGFVAGAAVGGYFLNMWLAAKFPRYTSTATIRVQVPSELPTVGAESRLLVADPSPQSIELEQQTQAASLKSKYFLGSLLDSKDSPIRKTHWFQEFGNRVEDAKDDLQKKLEVTPLLNTRLLEISMSAGNPNDALVIVREIVQRHIEDRRQNLQNLLLAKSYQVDSLIQSYQSQLADLNGRISNFDQQIAKNLGTSEQGNSGLAMEMNTLVAQKALTMRDFI